MGQKGRVRRLNKSELKGQDGNGRSHRQAGLKRRSSEEGSAKEGRAEEEQPGEQSWGRAGSGGRAPWKTELGRADEEGGTDEGRSESRKEFETLARNWNPGAGRQGSSPKARKPLSHPCLGRLLPRADACALSYLAHSVCSFWTSNSGHQRRTLA